MWGNKGFDGHAGESGVARVHVLTVKRRRGHADAVLAF